MTPLFAQIDVVEGSLPGRVVGMPSLQPTRTFAVLTLSDEEGNLGIGEAAPLPGYSPDTIDQAIGALHELIEEPIEVDPALPPRSMLDRCPEVQLAPSPAARFALETAILDWLGKSQGAPLYRLLATGHPPTIGLSTLVFESDPKRWAGRVDEMVADGSTHLKFKVGTALEREIAALSTIRGKHPHLGVRLDGNRRIDVADLKRHASDLESLNLEMFEEPVPPDQWREAVSLPLPFALDETLRDEAMTRELLNHHNVVAIVLKLAVIGGVTAAFDLASIARSRGAEPVLSHTFDGPIARAASAEVALALACEVAAGLGPHPGLDLWPHHSVAAIADGQAIRPHSMAGLGLVLGGVDA